MSIRVMLVDDHHLIRNGLKILIEDANNCFVVGDASSGEDAIAMARSEKPDIVLMDIDMPGIGGLGATQKILHMLPKTKVIMLTAYAHDILSARLLELGAYGYLMKTEGFKTILRAIRQVSKGKYFISPKIVSQISLAKVNNFGDSPLKLLSIKELLIVSMLAQGLTVEKIAKCLHLSKKTINTYRYSVFNKLSVKNNVEITLLAIKDGLSNLRTKQELRQENDSD